MVEPQQAGRPVRWRTEAGATGCWGSGSGSWYPVATRVEGASYLELLILYLRKYDHRLGGQKLGDLRGVQQNRFEDLRETPRSNSVERRLRRSKKTILNDRARLRQDIQDIQ